MANIILPGSGSDGTWRETPAERALREKGYQKSQKGILETGLTVTGSELRKGNAPGLLAKIARCLQTLCEKMADLRWDDDKVCLTIGVQVRNGWVMDIDGEWVEENSAEHIQKMAERTKRWGK